MIRQPVRGLKFQRFEISENSSWIKFHGPEIFLVDRFEMDEKCRKCRKNKFPRSDRYSWVMMFIDLVPIWKQFRTIFETSVLILEKHTPDKIHESETGRPFFFISNYRDVNAWNKYNNVNDVSYICISDSGIYWQIESNIFIYIYNYIFLCCFVEVIEETNLGLHRQMQRVEIPGSKVVEWSSKGCRIAPTINWFIPLWSLRNLKNQDESG